MSSIIEIADKRAVENAEGSEPLLPKQDRSHSMSTRSLSQSATIEDLCEFLEEIYSNKKPEKIVEKHLKRFPVGIKFIIEASLIEKFLPNIDIKSAHLLQLFGITHTGARNPKNPKAEVYFLDPRAFILATMINSVAYTDFTKQVKFAFKMYDIDSDEKISKADMKIAISNFIKENKVNLQGSEMIDGLVDAIFEMIKGEKEGDITQEEFQDYLSIYQKKGLVVDYKEKRVRKKTITEYRLSRMSTVTNRERMSTMRTPEKSCCAKLCEELRKMKNAWRLGLLKRIWLILWALGVWSLFICSFSFYFLQQKDSNWTFAIASGIAKGSAAILKLNFACMIALVTKSLTTVLRTLGFANILPLNYNVYFHQLLGYVTFWASWIHSVCHMVIVLPTFAQMNPGTGTAEWYITKSLPGWTGLACLFIVTMVTVLAMKGLRDRNYERFWYTHASWLILMVLLCVHGLKAYLGKPGDFWKWVGFPVCFLLMEKLCELCVYIKKQPKIVKLAYNQKSDIIELQISKPKNFRFIPGQYAKIKIPVLSKFQWHPFSFSSSVSLSSSQNQQTISFHINSKGNWKSDLKKLAIKCSQTNKYPEIYLMGPYGTPSQDYWKYENLMIVCTGVGATPFAAIIWDLISEKKRDPKNFKTKSIDFYWINRDPSSHIWLNDLFEEVKRNDLSDILTIQVYFTHPQQKYDLRSLLIWKGLEFLYEKQASLGEGLKHFNLVCWGRPEWNSIFERKAKRSNRKKIGLFYCGIDPLAQEIYDICQLYENFDFHKEIF